MPEIRLTKAERAALVEKVLREKVHRRDANRQALEDRIAKGRHWLEKTVPALFLPEIRRLVAAVIAELKAGREPRLRRGAPLPPGEPIAPDGADDPGQTTAPPPGTPSLGPAGRRRAQAARRRERQRAAGLSRTTFDVPTELVTKMSGLVDQLVSWMSEGRQVNLEVGPVPREVVFPQAAHELDPPENAVSRLLDDLVKPEGDPDGDMSPLFEDIQAAARLDWRE